MSDMIIEIKDSLGGISLKTTDSILIFCGFTPSSRDTLNRSLNSSRKPKLWSILP